MNLITGASGTVGSEVVKQHAAAGLPFRAAFHSEEKARAARERGIDAVVLDYTRPETLRDALEGIENVFLVAGGAPDQTQRELNVVEAAKAAGVKRIVKLSVWGADGDAFSFAHVHRPVEKAIEASGMTWTHLRPNGFMQNLHNYMAGTIVSQGAFYSSVGDAKIAHVDVRDIAAVAVKALTEPGHEGKSYSLSGPEALTYADVAAKLNAGTGREIRYVNVGDADVKAALVASGAPESYGDAFVDLLRYYRTGAAARITDDVHQVTGREPRKLDEYAKEFNSFV